MLVHPALSIYFITLFSLGSYIVISLFVGVLLEKFKDEGDFQRVARDKQYVYCNVDVSRTLVSPLNRGKVHLVAAVIDDIPEESESHDIFTASSTSDELSLEDEEINTVQVRLQSKLVESDTSGLQT